MKYHGMKRLLTTLSAALLLGTASAQHTFSIVAVDPATGEIGSAGATCLSSSDCGGCGGAIVISGLYPGKGAVNAQASVCLPNNNLNYAINLVAQGVAAPAVLTDVLVADPCVFGDSTARQYGIVTLDSLFAPQTAAYTGSAAMSYANHRVGATYTVQGNILLGPEVLDSLENAFNNTPGMLCEKLMAAMLAARIPGADTRCLSNGTSSKSAFIRIARPTDLPGGFWMDLNVPEVPAGMEPIDSLKTLFDAFKVTSLFNDTIPEVSRVYPNPATDYVQVRLLHMQASAGSMEIIDMAGRRVAHKATPAGVRYVSINVQHLPRGVYNLVVRSDHGLRSQRIILK